MMSGSRSGMRGARNGTGAGAWTGQFSTSMRRLPLRQQMQPFSLTAPPLRHGKLPPVFGDQEMDKGGTHSQGPPWRHGAGFGDRHVPTDAISLAHGT